MRVLYLLISLQNDENTSSSWPKIQSRTRFAHPALQVTFFMPTRVASGGSIGKLRAPIPRKGRTKAFLARCRRADLVEGSVFFQRVGIGNAQCPSGGKSPVVLSKSQEEPLGMGSTKIRRSAVEGGEIVVLLRTSPQLLAPGLDHVNVCQRSLRIGLAQGQPRLRGIDAAVAFDPGVVAIAAEAIVLRQGPLFAVPAVERQVALYLQDRLVGLLDHRDLDPVLDHGPSVAIVIVDPPGERGVQALQKARELGHRGDPDKEVGMISHEG